ncbi:exlusion protein FxsA [Spiribacter halobius]|uniref:Exlusion protein FxsA n=1 Tax=Sediminicurvatus halobius TaxID=2182432 RepID=A0A2U2N975_9GAMM|nr:exlusion protein FxsA [Spiribacter halobius]
MPVFLVLFLVVPLVEIYLLIEVGQIIGALPTIGLCVLTAAVGGALLRQQGLDTLARARRNLDEGHVPALELFEAVALAVGGALLLTPGFATDVIGFACLLPPTRRLLVQFALRRVNVVYGPAGRPGGGQGDRGRRDPRTIEGEYRRRDSDR